MIESVVIVLESTEEVSEECPKEAESRYTANSCLYNKTAVKSVHDSIGRRWLKNIVEPIAGGTVIE